MRTLRFNILYDTEFSVQANFGRKVMRTWMVWFPLKLLLWTLSIVGALALLLAAMIAAPLSRLPELESL